MAESEGGREVVAEHDQRRGGTERPTIGEGVEVVVVSNRQPYRHSWGDNGIEVDRPTGGLTAGLDTVVRRIEGSWIAWGDGDADAEAVDEHDRVSVPPDAEDGYPLRRVWLTEDQVDGYYYGFSNRVLWPICHGALTRVHSESEYWEAYEAVNERFADAVGERVGRGDVVWLQDYHFGLLPQMLRSRVPEDVLVTHFWHIPWPGWDTFRACPHGSEVLRGLLGNDLFVVHTERYRQNFLDCVEAAIPDAVVDRAAGRVFHEDGVTTVEAYPLGVDTERILELATDGDADERWRRIRSRYGIGEGVRVGVGVDRLDYTKGIPQRIDAVERLLERHPECRGTFTLVQIGSESRSRIPAYRELQTAVVEGVNRVNARFRTDDWRPIVYTTDRLSDRELYTLYRNADVGVVSPIRDGMNLVAQEYVAAQADGNGVLVLSRQAGAHDLIGEDAVSITPQDTDEFAGALHAALTMPEERRRERMGALVETCRSFDTEVWIEDVLGSVARLREEGHGG
ncbi:glycosyltransferase [Halobaculum sp. WSA2]|uniref:Glycosyltransferase n=1 Tax=Halobaculum saliterrae TaxID=2073113 RepID=A0A6B0SV38_9EURY|nr:trehalose-6-phosphate synthase [Halobaculum saliterrae]MXR42495.1 glycosyltransferase [Halobaculum saliterrae]